MSLEKRVNALEQENTELKEELDLLKFKFELLFDNSESSRYVIEKNFTRQQYSQIMDLMDKMREKIFNGEKVSSIDFESELDMITHNCDYHEAEILTRLFMEEGRWEEVFPALYGDSIKYKNYFRNKK